MIEDIFTDITQWPKLGDQLVLTIDPNENITSDTLTEIFVNLGLTEAITHHHCDTGLVTTYQILSHPIDGIYTSINL